MSRHGMKHTRIYETWCGMKKRCYNPNSKSYKDYGERGIVVCDEWKNDFLSFYHWSVQNGYGENLQIDRIDTNGNYEPSNCRWITHAEQQRNRRNNIYIEHNGQKKSLTQWCAELNFSSKIAYERYKRLKELNNKIDFDFIFSNKNYCKRPVLQYSLNGDLLKEWESAAEAGKNGFSRTSITMCCKNKIKTANGYVWRYAEN